jgi:hypothetical protein
MQYQTLAMYGQRGIMRTIRLGFVLSAVAALSLGIYSNAVPAYMVAAFLGIVVMGTWQHTKMWELAASAAEASLPPQKGTVLITVRRWSDSDIYSATVHTASAERWQFDFAAPHWKPTQGTFDATIYFVQGVSWPCLVETELGIVIPKRSPSPA